MVLRTLALGWAVSATLMSAAVAQETGRYRMSPVEDGFVRLDTETGAMSLCAKKDQSWSCTAMADDQAELSQRIEQLEAENKALREENQRLEDVFGLGDKRAEGGPAPSEPPAGSFKLPSEEDIDKGFDYLDRMLKKFRDRMKKLEDPDGPEGRTL